MSSKLVPEDALSLSYTQPLWHSKRCLEACHQEYFAHVITNNCLVVTRQFSRPRLVVSTATETSLRLEQNHKTCQMAGFV